MSTSELDPVPTEPITHFAPTEKRERQQDVMCGYVAPGDSVSMDPQACTCSDCRDWISPQEPPDPDGECFRGSEYASALAEQQAQAKRLK
jgi:hypothetical protein